jgi:TFIIF-interacting CTD phosphatase-like protein
MFMNRMMRNYEIVLFGDQEAGFVHEIADALDPNQQFIQGRLGRESTILKGNMYVKDFSYLGRPAKDIIYIDFDD